MASGIERLTFNPSGVKAVLNASGVQSDLLQRAMRIKAAADSMGSATYDADVQPGSKRAHAMVKTNGIHSARSNAKHNSLLKSIDAGR